jgi:hypothetical protein
MEAQELRIGNIVKDELTGEFMKISDLSENKINAEVIDRSKFPLPLGWKMTPIKLTEEILLKCGFKKKNTTWFSKDNFAINIMFDVEWCGNWIGIRINYLHQLQNIYWCLVGEELEINL